MQATLLLSFLAVFTELQTFAFDNQLILSDMTRLFSVNSDDGTIHSGHLADIITS